MSRFTMRVDDMVASVHGNDTPAVRDAVTEVARALKARHFEGESWVDRVGGEGARAARERRTESANPYEVGSIRWQAWRRGFDRERRRRGNR